MIERPSTVREASSATWREEAPRGYAMLDEYEYPGAPGKDEATFSSCGKSVAGGLSLDARMR